jgi:hypothetical protein
MWVYCVPLFRFPFSYFLCQAILDSRFLDSSLDVTHDKLTSSLVLRNKQRGIAELI